MDIHWHSKMKKLAGVLFTIAVVGGALMVFWNERAILQWQRSPGGPLGGLFQIAFGGPPWLSAALGPFAACGVCFGLAVLVAFFFRGDWKSLLRGFTWGALAVSIASGAYCATVVKLGLAQKPPLAAYFDEHGFIESHWRRDGAQPLDLVFFGMMHVSNAVAYRQLDIAIAQVQSGRAWIAEGTNAYSVCPSRETPLDRDTYGFSLDAFEGELVHQPLFWPRSMRHGTEIDLQANDSQIQAIAAQHMSGADCSDAVTRARDDHLFAAINGACGPLLITYGANHLFHLQARLRAAGFVETYRATVPVGLAEPLPDRT
jgi:hypothetical protein